MGGGVGNGNPSTPPVIKIRLALSPFFPLGIITMNQKLRDFEDAINQALSDADGDLEIAEVVGVLQMKLHLILERTMTRTEEADPADAWKFLKDEDSR